MNDLPWIKYEPQRMFLDTLGMSASGERAHRRLMDYLWINDGPTRNDNELLKQISQTAAADWGRTKLELLGKGWLEVGDFFLHRGAILSLNESKRVFAMNHNRTAAANKLPRLECSPPDPLTGAVRLVTLTVTPSVTPPITPPQEQEQRQEQEQGDTARSVYSRGDRLGSGEAPYPEANLPPESEVHAYGVTIGAAPATCKAFYDHHQNQQLWFNQFGRLIDWKRKLATWRDEDRQPGMRRGSAASKTIERERLKENLQIKTI